MSEAKTGIFDNIGGIAKDAADAFLAELKSLGKPLDEREVPIIHRASFVIAAGAVMMIGATPERRSQVKAEVRRSTVTLETLKVAHQIDFSTKLTKFVQDGLKKAMQIALTAMVSA